MTLPPSIAMKTLFHQLDPLFHACLVRDELYHQAMEEPHICVTGEFDAMWKTSGRTVARAGTARRGFAIAWVSFDLNTVPGRTLPAPVKEKRA